MCQAFSCLVTKSGKVYWKAGVDSHDSICELFVDPELVDDKLPPDNTFARVEIIPPRGDYLNTDFGKWNHQIDEKVKPSFLKPKHKKLCLEAFEKWTEEVYTFNVEEAKNPIHPLKITPPEITEEHIELLKKWDSVWDSVRASVGDSVRASVGASVRASVGASVWDSVWASVRDSVRASVGASVWDSVWASVWDSVWASVGASVWDSVWASVWASVRDSVGDSVWDSVGAYCGSLFPIKEWKYVDYTNPLFVKGEYPFQSCVDLWKQGLVPSFNGKVWRLRRGAKGEVLYTL